MRKLLWAAAGYIAALLAAHYLLPETMLLPAAFFCALLGLAALCLRQLPRMRKQKLSLVAVLVLLSAAAGFAWTWGYTALTIRPAEEFVGEKRSVTVVVTRYANVYDEYTRIEAHSVDAEVPHVRMLLYDYEADGAFDALRPGDVAELPLKLLSAGKQYGIDSDYYLSGGIHLRGYTTGTVTVTGRARLAALLYFPQELARIVKEQSLRCFPGDVAPLMKALLTGDRTEYYLDDGLYSAMRTAGFVHIIAVSGMHVAFLVSLLRLLSGRRRITAFLGIPLIAVFMAMAGFTPSVVRAGCMQILLLLAPLLRRESDPPTALAAAALLILLVNPIAVGSMSFQLSFAAMAGLIAFTPRIHDWFCYGADGKYRLPKGISGKVRHWIVSTFSASVGASVFTTPMNFRKLFLQF